MSKAEPKPKRRRPLTAHRWFAPALGLWGAALFGLCALAVPAASFEAPVAALGLAAVFPSMAPPLGETAHLLIAAALSSVGEIGGLLVGRALAGFWRPPAPLARADERVEEPAPDDERTASAEPSRPISAFAELGPQLSELAAPDVDKSTPAEAEIAVPCAAAGLAAAPLETLGVVQLSERLALAMRARRDDRGLRGSPAAAALARSARAMLGEGRGPDFPPAAETHLTLAADVRRTLSSARRRGGVSQLQKNYQQDMATIRAIFVALAAR